VHVAFDQVPQRFAIDQEAEVSIAVGEDRGIAVPLAALLRDGSGRQGVLVIENGRARFREVETAAADAASVLVHKGLAGGEPVVALAAGVKPGQRVRPAAL
jgi:multidrug efflux pump subunit AcrA (membrane-fusion protein)